MRTLALRRPRSLAAVWLIAGCLVARVPSATAAPARGFVEHWNSGTTSGWGGGDVYSNPGTGGVQGAGDGYLLLSTPGPSPTFILNLGANNSGLAYAGNWVAAGIQSVQLWLDDVDGPRPLEIHFGLGSLDNFWQYDAGFVPPANAWAPFVVDLTGGPTGWTQIISATIPPGTFSDALQAVDRVLIRHDRAPYTQAPDTITAVLGLDELSLLPSANAGVAPDGAATPRAIMLAPPVPNPSRGGVELVFESFDTSPVHIEILDAAGRRVRRVELDLPARGPHRWTWDGRTEAGAAAAAGAYRARVYGASGGMSRPFVWLGAARE